MGNKIAHLLVVEDDDDIAAMLSITLRMDGYAVSVVNSLVKAREHLGNSPVDLIITDWQLLDGTADEVCAAARATDPTIPIIVVSALTRERTEALESCNPQLYLRKPVPLQILRSSIQSLLPRRPSINI